MTEIIQYGVGDKIYQRLYSLSVGHQLSASSKVSPHFSLGEFRCHKIASALEGQLPPYTMFTNIAPTLVFLELLRHECRTPLTINSCWRPIWYNNKIGGASKSTHVLFKAADVNRPQAIQYGSYENPSNNTFWQKANTVAGICESVFGFSIRLGWYSSKTFIHVDCQPNEDGLYFAKRWQK